MTFVAIEGADGSGKSSHIEKFRYGEVVKYRADGKTESKPIVYVPGCSDSPIGKLVRRGLSSEEPMDPYELQAAYTADRLARDHELRKLSQSNMLVADRWTMSALVYGALHLEDQAQVEFHRNWLMQINSPVIIPDIYIVLRVSADTAMQRLAKRSGKAEIYERADVVAKVCRAYSSEEVIKWFNLQTRVVCLDAERPFEQVAKAIATVIASV